MNTDLVNSSMNKETVNSSINTVTINSFMNGDISFFIEHNQFGMDLLFLPASN